MRARARRSEGHRRRIAGDGDGRQPPTPAPRRSRRSRAVSTSINPNLTATITFTDDIGNYSYSLVDTTGALPTVNGTGTWIAGQPIALNGFELRAERRAAQRRHARRRRRPRSRPATTATRNALLGAARRAVRRPADARPAASSRPATTSPTPTRPRSPTIGVRVQSARLVGRPVGERSPPTPRPRAGREGRRQPRRGSGAPDPVPAELPGRGEDAAGRAVGVRHAAAGRR